MVLEKYLAYMLAYAAYAVWEMEQFQKKKSAMLHSSVLTCDAHALYAKKKKERERGLD
jgi:hypothetical protein